MKTKKSEEEKADEKILAMLQEKESMNKALKKILVNLDQANGKTKKKSK